MRMKQAVFGLIALITSACSPVQLYQGSANEIVKTQERITELKETKRGEPAVVMRKQAFVDATPIYREIQPAWMSEQVSISASDMPFDFVVFKVMEGSNIPVKFDTEVAKTAPASVFVSGTRKAALEALAATSGYAYSIEDGVLVWHKYVVRTFDIAFTPGSTSYRMGGTEDTSGGSMNGRGGLGDSTIATAMVGGQLMTQNNSEYSNSAVADLSLWEDLEQTLKQIVGKEGSVIVSQATTTVTVRTTPERIKRVAEYIETVNRAIGRQVLLEVQVLEVSLNEEFSFGINWDLIRQSVGKLITLTSSMTSNVFQGALAPATFAYTIPPDADSRWAGSKAFIDALQTQGDVSIVTQPRAVTLNNQVAEIKITNQTTYLAASQTTVTPDVGATTALTPGVVTDGFRIYLLPKISGEKIFLRISSSLSSLLNIGRVETDSSAIETPVLSEKAFNQWTRLRSGQTLVLAGLRQATSQQQKSTPADFPVISHLFGAKSAQQRNTETIVLITPTILNDEEG